MKIDRFYCKTVGLKSSHVRNSKICDFNTCVTVYLSLCEYFNDINVFMLTDSNEIDVTNIFELFQNK